MKIINKDPSIIRRKGLEILKKELGPLGMTSFIRQFDTGQGNYTREKEELQKDVTIENILTQIKAKRNR